jgi:hypothetical protein
MGSLGLNRNAAIEACSMIEAERLAQQAGADGDERYGTTKPKGQREADDDPCPRKTDNGSRLQGASWWTQQSDHDHEAHKKRQASDDFASMQKLIHCPLPDCKYQA